jgi:hypothetical protein
MQKEIDALVQKAETNIAEDKSKVAFPETDLVGVPPEIM